MDPSQPILHRRRRVKPVDPCLSYFVESRDVATEKQSLVVPAPGSDLLPSASVDMSESLENPRSLESPPSHGDIAVNPFLATDAAETQTEDSSKSILHPHSTLGVSSASLSALLSPTLLATITRAESSPDRKIHNAVTYKKQRTLRTRPASQEHDTPRSTQEPFRADTPASTPSCSPAPMKSRKRRRRLPPLKNRLARVARARRARQKSQETLSQPSVSVSLDPDADYVPPMVEPNITQRRLVAPQNYTIPDLKDLLNSKSQAHVDQVTAMPVETQRNPLPQFVLPPVDGLHTQRFRPEFKPVRARRRDLGPRLNFVPLEAHQEQATATARPNERRASHVVKVHPLPLVEQASPSKLQAYNHQVFGSTATTSPNRVTFANSSLSRSPYRVLVEATPEPEESTFPAARYPGSDRAQAPAHRIHPLDTVSVRQTGLESIPTPPARTQFTPPPTARTLAPMSDLFDNLVKLARSAAEMKGPVSPSPVRSSSKRPRQTTLVRDGSAGQLLFESVEPSKSQRVN